MCIKCNVYYTRNLNYTYSIVYIYIYIYLYTLLISIMIGRTIIINEVLSCCVNVKENMNRDSNVTLTSGYFELSVTK